MKWLERLRAKTGIPTGDALTKLTKVSVAGSVSVPSGGAAVLSTSYDPLPVETRGDGVAGLLPLQRSSATASIGGGLDRTGEHMATLKLVSLHVPYQPIWYDFNVADGAYTPQELHRAGKVVKPGGRVQHYTLQWPAVDAGLLNPSLRSATMDGHALQRVNIDEPADNELTKLTQGSSRQRSGEAYMRDNIQGRLN